MDEQTPQPQPEAPETPQVDTTPPSTTPPPVEPVTEVKKGGKFNPGLVVGLIVLVLIAFGSVIYFMMQGNKPAEPEPAPLQTETQVPAQPELTLSLTSPTADTLAENKMVTVAGTTLPNTPVVMMTEETENSVVSDENGNFSGEIELMDGVNTLIVTAMSEDGREKSETREIVFDDQVLGINTEGNGSTTKPDKKIVKNDVETIKKTYKVDKTTKYASEKNKPLKAETVKPKEKAVAVIENGSATQAGQLKKAIKIFVRSATESAQIRMTKRRAVQGVVVNIEGSTLYLAHQTQRDRQYLVMFNQDTTVKIKGVENGTTEDIQVGQRVVAIGNVTETNDLVATRIHVIPGLATGIYDKQPVTPFPTATITPSPTATPSATPSPTPEILPVETPIPLP